MKRRFEEIGIKIDKESTKMPKPEKRQKMKNGHFENKSFSKQTFVPNQNKKTINDLIEAAPKVEETNAGTLIGLMQTLEKAQLKNLNMRSKYSDNPNKFMQSELDLSDAIKAIKDVAVAPKLYENLVQNNLPKIVSELLSHENTDIVIETINLLKELADPTTFFEKSPILDFLKALSKRNVFNLVSDNLERLSENNEDSEGLFDALSIFESIMETDQRFFMETFIKSKLGNFLLKLLGNAETDQKNIFYGAELIAIFVNISPTVSEIFVKNGFFGVARNALKKKMSERIDKENTEFLNNILDALTTISVIKFSQNGEKMDLDLMNVLLSLIKKRKFKCRLSALNAISANLVNFAENCKLMVQNDGLKILFSDFSMRFKHIFNAKKHLVDDLQAMEQLAIIFIQCFINLRETEYLRFFGKFLEKECDKIDSIVIIFDTFLNKMDVLEKSINSDTKLRHFSEKKKYLFKHEKGGYLLSLIATLIGFVLTSNSQKAFKRTLEMLSQRDVVIEDVKKCLRDYLKFMEGTEGNKPVTREILENILKLIK